MYAPRNLGAQCDVLPLCANKSATAASTGDGTEVSSAEVDLLGYSSAKIVISYATALTAEKTLTFETQKAERRVASGAYDADAAVEAATTVATETDANGVHTIDLDLSAYKRFAVFKFTPQLNADNTDTVNWSAALLLFGKDSR